MNKIDFILIPILFLCFSVSCNSNDNSLTNTPTYYGVVINSQTNEPYPNITVEVTNGYDSRVSTKTDATGKFKFLINIDDLSGDYYISIGNINTEKKRIELTGVTKVEIDLGTIPINPMPVPTILSFKLVEEKDFLKLDGEVQLDKNWTIEEVGFCYAKDKNPLTDDINIKAKLNGSTFSATLNLLDLDLESVYYFSAYAINRAGIGYSNVTKYITDETNCAVNTLEVSNITSSTATLNGEVIKPGYPKYIERGFIYDTQSTPTVDKCIKKISAPLTDDSKYSCNIDGLSPVNTYYARTYIIQDGKTIYGNTVSFSTGQNPTTLKTSSVTEIGANKATFNASVLNIGTPAYTEKGFCYSKKSEPTITDNHKSVSGTGTGTYSLTVQDLEYPVTYYVRAYAIQGGQPIYGNNVSFSTNSTSTSIITYAATDITSSSAVLNGSIGRIGSPAYTEKGFCISTSGYSEPTINDIKFSVSGNSEGNFSLRVNNLEYDKRYTYRSYAIQDGKVIYGNTLYFITNYTKATVSTSNTTDVMYTTATFHGSVNNIGDPRITERGFCYKEGSSYPFPTVNDKKVKVTGIAAGDFKTEIKTLEEEQTYSVRAYVIQNGSPIYGEVQTFKTYYSPIVVTGKAGAISEISILNWQATFAGIFADGDPYVTEAGFVYSTLSNPTVSNSTVVRASDVKYLSQYDGYQFTRKVTDLIGYQTYYFRAYVRTKFGYVYGTIESFSTY